MRPAFTYLSRLESTHRNDAAGGEQIVYVPPALLLFPDVPENPPPEGASRAAGVDPETGGKTKPPKGANAYSFPGQDEHDLIDARVGQ
jgi:hypothetical protein